MPTKRPSPVILCVLDGFGVAPEHGGNAIARAKKPVLDALIRKYPAMTLRASGLEVGLARGEMGNSEVGHLSIGSGRIFYQNRPRIDKEIQAGTFFENAALLKATKHVAKNGSKLHLLGLVSPGGVHSHQEHCFALLDFAKRQGVKDVYLHVMLDGRDAIYNSGLDFVRTLQKKCKEFGVGRIATVMGRYYAMDRDNRWDREELAYRAMVDGVGPASDNPIRAIEASYAKKVYDEEFVPTIIGNGGKPTAMIAEGDAVVFFNFRADRARQLTHAFVDAKFDRFARGDRLKNLAFTTLMEYEAGLPVDVAFPSEEITTCLAKVWSEEGLKQLHIAETEKYAHVTFFMNGMREDPYRGEERVLVPSPKVATYDLKPEMSAHAVAARVVKEAKAGSFDGIIMNFANPDMVGHTGKVKPTIAAVEATDACIGTIVDAVVSNGGVVVITADHGNAEEVMNLQTGEMDKEHATNPVPLIICGAQFEEQDHTELEALGWDLSLLQPVGMLADVAPTVLKIMGIRKPAAMTGQSLL
ncbi:2,3-bisphosphoglycerate-independent phosphoglycerate mutase [Candidatus Uhrbacteria bacterium]|nr:2,3-bisphosphoglycerate-independent phosphoglycerate mutase [Candidatus Uhrbacteria bacterium]